MISSSVSTTAADAGRMEFLRHLLRETGYVNTAVYLAARVAARLLPRLSVHRYLLVAQPIAAEPMPSRRVSGGIAVRQVVQGDYQDHWFPRPKANIDARFRQHAICLVAFKREEPIGSIWLKPGPYLEDEVRCQFVPLPAGSTMWDFDVYVAPGYRSTRVFSYLWNAACDWARDREISWTVSRIGAFNLPSVRSHRRLGAQVVGTATFLVCGNFQLSLIPDMPFVHMSFSEWPEVAVRAPELRLVPGRES